MYFEVVAPSPIPRPLGDRMKTDRHDALMLTKIDLKVVRGPDDVDKAARELVRTLEDAVRGQPTAHGVGHWQAT